MLTRANAALEADRLFEPAGDNALELYLAAITQAESDGGINGDDAQRRGRRLSDALASNDAVAQTRLAIGDILPYGLIWVERAVAAGEFAEAERVIGLLEQAGLGSASLQRLRESLQLARTPVAPAPSLAQGTAASTQVAAPEPARPVTTTTDASGTGTQATLSTPVNTSASASGVSAAPAPSVADIPQTPSANATANVPVARASSTAAVQTPTVTAAPVNAASQVRAVEPRLLSQPSLRYPPRAQRNRVEGFVRVAYVIRPDGSTAQQRIVWAEPEGIFDREALRIAEGLKFAPLATEAHGEQRIDFRLGQ